MRPDTRNFAFSRFRNAYGKFLTYCIYVILLNITYFHPLQGPFQLALRIVAGGDFRGRPRLPAAGHRARVRTMGGDHFAPGQFHVRQEPLVAPENPAPGQGREFHRSAGAGRPSREGRGLSARWPVRIMEKWSGNGNWQARIMVSCPPFGMPPALCRAVA